MDMRKLLVIITLCVASAALSQETQNCTHDEDLGNYTCEAEVCDEDFQYCFEATYSCESLDDCTYPDLECDTEEIDETCLFVDQNGGELDTAVTLDGEYLRTNPVAPVPSGDDPGDSGGGGCFLSIAG